MTDINKLIENEAVRYAANEYYCTEEAKGILYNGTLKDFKAGASFILHQNRWRKVEEEFPEVKDDKYQILIRIINIPTSATVWIIRNESDCDIIRKMKGSEWKPIE